MKDLFTPDPPAGGEAIALAEYAERATRSNRISD
jgi:hypothetical protein